MESNLIKRWERTFFAPSARKRLLSGVAATVASVMVFAFAATMLIAASPALEDSNPLLNADIGPTRIEAPVPEVTSLPPRETEPAPSDELITEKVGAIFAAAPSVADPEPVTETVALAETEAEVTEEPIPEAVTEAVAVTEPAPEAVPEAAPEPEVIPEPEPVPAPVPETVPEPVPEPEVIPEPTPEPAPAPAPAYTLLADELGIWYWVESTGLKVSEEDINLCATIIQLEVMGATSSLYRFDDVTEKYWEMLAVAQCIRNRAVSSKFPDTVKKVILQNHTTKSGKVIYQFSPADVLSQYTPTPEAVRAAREVLLDGVTVLQSDYYYFCATRIEKTFESTNDYMLGKNANGAYIKTVGHLTTFYAGRK